MSGIVENPSDLNDQFALVTPSSAARPQTVTVLLDASPADFNAFRASFRGPLAWQARGPSTQGAVAGVALALVTVLLLLVSLVAAAGFAVIAARRQRQLGMLAAIGATRKQLRMVMVAGGAIVGVIAAVAGTVAGLAAGGGRPAPGVVRRSPDRPVRHPVEPGRPRHGAGGRDGDRLGVVASPGGRPAPGHPRPVGPAAAAQARPPPGPAGRPADRDRRRLPGPGQPVPPAADHHRRAGDGPGDLVHQPAGHPGTGRAGRRAPVAVRLALRDLARYQARSGAALAAISLALGITAAIIISSAADKAAATAGNLPGTQIAAWIGQPEAADSLVPIRTPAQLGALAAAVHQIARPLHHATVITLDMPVNPADKPQPGSQGSPAGQPVASLGAPLNPAAAGRAGTYRSIPLYVATPAVLRYLGIGPAAITPATDILTTQAGQLMLSTNTTFADATRVQHIEAPGYTSAPTSLMTLAGLHRRHWRQIQSGWLIKSSQPLTADQLAAAQEVAAKAGLVIEARNTQASLAAISAAATAAGALLALGVLAMTIGLIRTEAAGDLRTLTATGATSTTRRTLTATTAGALALLGALIGAAGAYLALAAGYRSDPGVLSHPPVLYLAITILGVPAAAALAGWLLAGRQPPTIARRVLE